MALSSHLLDQYEDRKQFLPPHMRSEARSPHPGHRQQSMDPDATWISHHGAAQAGGWGTQMSNMSVGPRYSQWSEEKVAELQARLSRKLGPEYVTQRPGPGGGPKLSYIEGWKVINLANEVFGFNGWSSSITQLNVDFLDVNEQGRCSVNVTAIVRITLQDGCYHEDVGCGQGENIKGKGAALDKAKKEAVTDATKRCLKTFGNVLGNCLYDKEYTKEVVKMKVPPAKFNGNNLERRPEFTEHGAGPSNHAQAALATPQPPRAVAIQQEPAKVVPPLAPGTPLNDIGNALVDLGEGFDAEFSDMDAEAFLESMDQSTDIKPEPARSDTSMQPPIQSHQAGPSRVSVQQQPQSYLHRQRPDLPANNTPSNLRPAYRNADNPEHMKGSTLRQSTTAETLALRQQSVVQTTVATSSGGSSNTLPDTSRNPRPVGGFVYPNQNNFAPNSNNSNAPSNPTSGSSARAAAIASALRSAAVPPAETDLGRKPQYRPQAIRAESPRIPSGGVDQVASRATNNLRANGIQLNLESGQAVGDIANTNGSLGGFASARGMKRSISEDQADSNQDQNQEVRSGYQRTNGSKSPTKPHSGSTMVASKPVFNSNGLPLNAFAAARGSTRQALVELNVDSAGGIASDYAGDWNAKRQRAG